MNQVVTALIVLSMALVLVGGLDSTASAASDEEFILSFPHGDAGTAFLSEFGVAKPDGRLHRGVDLFAARGSAVVAGADGFIQVVKRGSRAGLYVVVRHADGYETWYLHLSAFAETLAVGDPVAAGDVIGYVGTTGNAAGTSPHTHFELHANGRAIDPYPFLRESLERRVLAQQIEAGVTRFR